jgi:hypothetical protein
MPTKEELEAENANLRELLDQQAAEIDRLNGELLTAVPLAGGEPAPAPARPRRPSFKLSEGERAELASRGVTTSPWTGEQLNAVDQGIETVNEEAEERAARANAAAEKARAAAGPGA